MKIRTLLIIVISLVKNKRKIFLLCLKLLNENKTPRSKLGVNVKVFYLRVYSIALRTLLHSPPRAMLRTFVFKSACMFSEHDNKVHDRWYIATRVSQGIRSGSLQCNHYGRSSRTVA